MNVLTPISREEVRQHNSPDDGWIVLMGKVYDMSGYHVKHPGGDIICRHFGEDATEAFNEQASHRIVKGLIQQILTQRYVGELNSDTNS